MFDVIALAARDTSGVLHKETIKRREPLARDLKIRILYCGVCHSDLHQIRAEWPTSVYYPMVPGHEMIGVVEEAGSEVTKFKVGQPVGVGVIVDSCGKCDNCAKQLQQYCIGQMGFIDRSHGTYNCCLKDEENIHIHNSPWGELLFGGYSSHITVTESFVVAIPESMDLSRCGPLLCAGITVWSPLKHFGPIVERCVGTKDLRVGVAGFGGLGHMAVKFAKELGYQVTVISQSPRKKEAALAAGASDFVDSNNKSDAGRIANSLHFIIDTISANHDIIRLLKFLTTDGMCCVLGLPPDALAVGAFDIVTHRRAVVGSLIGGVQETQEMMNFAAKNGIYPDCEIIDAKSINHALYELSKSEASSSRYVIDMSTLPSLSSAGGWDADPEPSIDIHTWRVHKQARIFPTEANIHSLLLHQDQGHSGKRASKDKTKPEGGGEGGGKGGVRGLLRGEEWPDHLKYCVGGTVAVAVVVGLVMAVTSVGKEQPRVV